MICLLLSVLVELFQEGEGCSVCALISVCALTDSCIMLGVVACNSYSGSRDVWLCFMRFSYG